MQQQSTIRRSKSQNKFSYKSNIDKNGVPMTTGRYIFTSFIAFVSKSFDLIRSVLIRIVFGVHALVAIVVVCHVKNELWYFVNSIGVVLLIIEWFVIAFRHGGKDLPWFSPSFFIYILTLIPPTWFLELENIRIKTSVLNANKPNMSYTINEHTTVSDSGIPNQTRLSSIHKRDTGGGYYYDDVTDSIPPIMLSNEIKAALNATVDQYAIYIEVSMMLIIILGRWIMPKQGITRSELSQLLLVYMSLASDVIDLLSVLQEQAVMINMNMVYTALSVYSWSLFQFTLNLVVIRGRTYGSKNSLNAKTRYTNKVSIHNELWNVLITLVMQDCPFFILRVICVVRFNVFNYSFLFFTFKNGILFALQIYRIIAILTDKDYNYDPTTSESNCGSNGVAPNMSFSNLSSSSSNRRLNNAVKVSSILATWVKRTNKRPILRKQASKSSSHNLETISLNNINNSVIEEA